MLKTLLLAIVLHLVEYFERSEISYGRTRD
jgi:hypothetical protein